MHLDLLPELLDHAAGLQLLLEQNLDPYFLPAATFLGCVDMPEATLPDGLGRIAKVEVVPCPGR